MALPDIVTKGNPATAKWANDVVQSLKDSTYNNIHDNRMPKKIFKPFDIVASQYFEDIGWCIKLQKAYYYRKTDKHPGQNWLVPNKIIDPDGNPLEDYAWMEIQQDKSLYFNYSTRALQWDNDATNPYGANLKVVEFTWDGTDIWKAENVYGKHVDLRNCAPFTALFCKAPYSGDYVVALTEGVVAERIVPSSDVGWKYWEVADTDAGDYIWTNISLYYSLYINVNTNTVGQISTMPTRNLQSHLKTSTHYIPPVAGVSGTNGNYFYEMAQFNATGLNPILAGSDIEYDLDVPWIDNTIETATTGKGRVVKEYHHETGEYLLRSIDRGYYEQINVTEGEEGITIDGNSYNADCNFTYGNDMPFVIASCQDGLVTDLEGFSVPEYIAGENITFTPNGNEITISASLSGGGTGTGGLSCLIYDTNTVYQLLNWENGLVTTSGHTTLVFSTLAGGGHLIAVNT